jgi:hypothetical protein
MCLIFQSSEIADMFSNISKFKEKKEINSNQVATSLCGGFTSIKSCCDHQLTWPWRGANKTWIYTTITLGMENIYFFLSKGVLDV